MLSLYISCKAVLLYQRYFFLFIFFFLCDNGYVKRRGKDFCAIAKAI